MISFLKTEVDTSEEISLNKFPDFISSVGGNLGLFTGFSFLSALFVFVEWLHKCIGKKFGNWIRELDNYLFAMNEHRFFHLCANPFDHLLCAIQITIFGRVQDFVALCSENNI